MEFHHRKLLSSEDKHSDAGSTKNPNNLSLLVVLFFCTLGTAFLVVCYFKYFKKYNSNSNNSRRRNPQVLDQDQGQEDFIDENHGPVLDHPIWYIRTVGLQQSVIESISVFKYKKDEGLVEGTDCSVCLNEFEEDENLRLLPKCSHAFHIACIDTWLRSHKNCPLCRAPIVCENAHVSATELNLSHLGPEEEAHVEENLESYGGLGGHQDEDRASEVGIGSEDFNGLPSERGRIPEIMRKDLRYFNAKNCEIRVLSDLADHRRRGEEELQPVRRSVSLDASDASRIYLDVANLPQLEACSSTQLVQVKKPSSKKVAKGMTRNLSIARMMKSSSMRFSLQNGPVAMKRSLSSIGKFSSSRRYSRSQDSVLPL
ncbi:RING-H2 finger protein [Actinidia chinensis var. chinensis]|uniref:RING-type E3 ubiquitin transferase n=1 Tax=Actinidia chinensis var. chinensis TaxID=1590841 RepID=A0A2R6RJD3_ACTCC|nr:RING-H2 finger protein [Actinidia chinensis var. chinensis]